MAAINLIEFLKTAHDAVMQGIIESIVTTDQVVANIPFRSVGQADHLTWNREQALPAVTRAASGDTITPSAALQYDRVTAYLRRFIIDQDIDTLDAGAAGGMVPARADAIAKAAKTLARTYGLDLFAGAPAWTVTINDYGASGATSGTIVVGPGHDARNNVGLIRVAGTGTTVAYKAPGDADYGAAVTYTSGVKVYSQNQNKWVTVTLATLSANGIVTFSFASNTNQIDGLARLVGASQTISASNNGDAITLATLDQLADLVTDTSGPKAYLMHSRPRRAVMALLRAAGGASLGEFAEMQFGTGRVEKVPTYNGIPILRSDFISIADTQGSSNAATKIYCATLSEQGGVCGIYSEAGMDDADGEMISQGANGIQALSLGTVQTTDAKRTRVRAYWGVASKTERGLAVASGITS